MFENDIDRKGLFTFYREQAQFEQKIAKQQKVQKAKSQSTKFKYMRKFKLSQHDIMSNDINESTNQSTMNHTEKLSPKKSFQELNKAYIKRLSFKNDPSPSMKSKQLASQMVVILKGNKAKQDLKLNKLDLKYQMQEGHFLKQKHFDPLQQVDISSDQIPQNLSTTQETYKIKRTMKRNQSLNDRYGHSKSQLQNQLILSKQLRKNRQNTASVRFQGLKKVDMLNQLPQVNRSFTMNYKSSNHLVHKRIPPKVLASLLKSQNNEIIRDLRKAIQKEREDERKSSMVQRNHSFIEYESFDYEKKQLDIAKLNQKQRRMINILNKFGKRA